MSTGSPRPGVTVEQVNTPGSPTIQNPSLIPCIVGPCFAITDPTNPDGSLNPETEVSTPAIITGTAVLGELVAVASEVVALQVDSDDVQVVTLPAVAVGSNLKRDSLASVLEQRLTGVKVRLEENRLVFTSRTKGDSSRLRFWSKAALIDAAIPGIDGSTVLAHTDLKLDSYEDIDVYGQGAYTGISYTVPFDQFPVESFHPSADRMVFDTEEIDIYRYFLGKLTKLSATGAVNWTSRMTAPTKVMNTAVTFLPPFTAGRKNLYAKDSTGQNTNKVFNLGVDSWVMIPLANQLSYGTPWPDASGQYSLYAEALGSQNYLNDQSAGVGAFVGTLGNAVKITFALGGGPSLVWDGGAKTLTVNYLVGTTWDALQALIDADAVIPTVFHEFTLTYPASVGAEAFDASGALDTRTFYLSGGTDPVDFSVDYTATVDDDAVIMGSVGVTDARVATVQGKTLSINVNGNGFEDVVIPSTVADLLTAINAVADVSASAVALVSDYDESPAAGNGLKIEATGSSPYKGHASTLEIKGDPGVIETLFSGYISAAETLSNGAGGAGITEALVSGVDFNKGALTNLETALVPDTTTLTLGGVVIHAYAVANSAALTASGGANIQLQHSAFHPNGGALGDAFTLVGVVIDPDPAVTAANINAALTATAGDGATPAADSFIAAAALQLGDDTTSVHLHLYDVDGTVGNEMQLLAAGTDATFKADLDGGVLDMFDVPLVTLTDDLSISDVSSDSDLPMRATAATASFPAPAGFSFIDDSASGAPDNYIDYATGSLTVALKTQLVTSPSYSRVISYTRGAANYMTRNILNYEGVVWTGRSSKVVSGDKLYNDGNILASVVKLENLQPLGAPASPWGDNAVLVLSSEAVSKGRTISDWYIRAEKLASSNGRTIPEIVFNEAKKTVTIRPAVNRGTDGIPLSGSATIYVGFRALRLDVTPEAGANASVLIFEDVDEVSDLIGPISTSNPLAWGLYSAMLNAPSISIKALGVAEISANSPDGTVAAYKQAFDFLENYEVYAVAPTSQDPGVIQLLNLHVTSQSEPENKHERIGIACPLMPTEKTPLLAASGNGVLATEVSADKWQFDFGGSVNMVGSLNGKTDANGNTISAGVGSTFTTAQGIFLTREGDPFKYLVTKLVSASVVECDLNVVFDEAQGPGSFGNDDAYYYTSSDQLDLFDVAGETCAVSVRQAGISTSTTTGKTAIMTTLSTLAESYANKRLVLVQPEQVSMSENSIETIVPGYYLCCAIAGMVGQYRPSQPFTNVPMVGFIRPFGSSDTFAEKLMAVAAGGGIYWVIQDEQGQPLFSRHQLTTDMTDLKTKELSVIKAVDYAAKIIRATAKRFIGNRNITKEVLRTVNIALQGVITGLAGTILEQVSLDKLEVDPDNLDQLLVDISVVPYYPLNRIKIRLVI